jgi:hypothetical protein
MPAANTAAPVLQDAIIFQTSTERDFWEKVYFASVSTGRGIARKIADQAVQERRDRNPPEWADDLGEEEP